MISVTSICGQLFVQVLFSHDRRIEGLLITIVFPAVILVPRTFRKDSNLISLLVKIKFFPNKIKFKVSSNLYTARTYPRLGSSHDLVRHSYCSSSVRCYRVPHGSDDRLWSKDPWIFGPRVRLGWRCHVETAHYDGRQNLHGEFQVHQQPKLLCNCHLGRPNCPKDSEWHIRADLFNPKPGFLYLESLSHSQ